MINRILTLINLSRPITAEKCFVFFVVLFAGTIPFHMGINNLLILPIVITFMLSEKRYTHTGYDKILVTIASLYFGIHLISLLYTSNVENGFFQIEKRLHFIIFPLVFYFKNATNDDLLNRCVRTFIWAVFIALIACILLSGYILVLDCMTRSVTASEFVSYFSYETLSKRIGLHPTYLSMYVLFSLAVLLNDKKKRLYLILFLVVMIILLSSRIAIVSFFLMVGLLFVRQSNKNYKKLVVVALVFIAVLSSIMLISPEATNRHFLDYFSITHRSENTGINMRMIHWLASIEVVRSNFLWGVGLGDSQDVLDKIYSEMRHENFIGFNSHSQYLWDIINFGLLGVILLLTNFILPFILRYRSLDSTYCCFVLIVATFCLTECLFHVNKGISFYGFFNSLFLFYGRNSIHNTVSNG